MWLLYSVNTATQKSSNLSRVFRVIWQKRIAAYILHILSFLPVNTFVCHRCWADKECAIHSSSGTCTLQVADTCHNSKFFWVEDSIKYSQVHTSVHWFSRFYTANHMRPTQTDHATCYICWRMPHLCAECRPKNNNESQQYNSWYYNKINVYQWLTILARCAGVSLRTFAFKRVGTNLLTSSAVFARVRLAGIRRRRRWSRIYIHYNVNNRSAVTIR